MSKYDTDNPVLENYKGINIRHSNTFHMRMDGVLFKFLVLESERTGFAISKILSLSSKPCERCSNIDVISYNENDEEIKIRRGILFDYAPSKSSGTSIIKQANAKSK